jgi:hypothetical protein
MNQIERDRGEGGRPVAQIPFFGNGHPRDACTALSGLCHPHLQRLSKVCGMGEVKNADPNLRLGFPFSAWVTPASFALGKV